MSKLFDLTGKVAVLTGASKGMGLAMATGLAEHGAKVVISARKQDQLDAAAAQINETVGAERAIGIACNIGYKEQLEALVTQTREKLGAIDVVVGNAGVNPYYGVTSEIPDDAYEKTMQANVQSNLWLAQLVAPDMVAKGSGSMMFTSSIGAFKPSVMLGTYGMSKLALIGLVRNLAAEFGPKGLRFNAICPGLVRTDFARELWDNPEVEERIRKDIPLRRLGEPEDFAGVAVYLASDASKYMTGQALTVCGGSNMWT
ncbi:SDR family oxidoreductase [Phaeobacter sp. QD34_3]|uniref:SDR family NAD(P)-dependent oxidoreductase n=1 Tax=unclassified Phaeobacter TaxID=2621772 RepID=UPI00237F37E7|nr:MULTISPECIES: SDR family oxidoreductase [unclassified Phaeobacter]MDE4133012.1 SDR family oxidoreductase [Phaeobacter sp. QD34_3]MDE4136586.1 SDR family oxidoreductase [Phaeobacter sp. QD34_24]MDE4174228.1 SDR family oxidoreductase [Phaeobacter sp. PT47_59]